MGPRSSSVHRRTSTPSAATTCHRSSPGRSSSSTCPTCSTRSAELRRRAPGPDHRAARRRDRPCLLSPTGERWTYGELLATSNRVAHVLVDELGVVPGNRVLLRGPNNPWLVACWFGVLQAGAVVVTTMPLLRPAELSTVHEIAQIDVALCDHRFLDDLRASDLGGVPIVAYGGDEDDDLGRRVMQVSRTSSTPVDTAADDVALLAFTSGTTGRPKATMHFHRDVLANADTFSTHVLRPTPDDVFTGTPPLAFTFGLGGLVVFPLRVGASTLLIEKATPDELAEHIAEHGVTICFTAPTAYRAMLAGEATERLSSRYVAACRPASTCPLPRGTRSTRPPACGSSTASASTEMLHIFISAADDDIRPGSTGVAGAGIPGDRRRRRRQPVAGWASSGRLAVKGPTGCRYLADPRQAVYVQNGWNITGDTFVQDERRLLLVPGAQRRHDHLVGLQHRRAGGRGGGAASSRRRRVRRRRHAGRGTVASSSRRTSCCATASRATPPSSSGAAGLRQGRDRAVQVPARGRFRRQPAAHEHRQAAALPPPRRLPSLSGETRHRPPAPGGVSGRGCGR